MTTKHTPGPWSVFKDGREWTGDDWNERAYIKAANGGGEVALVFHCGNPRKAFGDESLSDMPEGVDAPIREANARLIAAAPELLEALRDAQCALECCGKDYPAATKARAAIAKATQP